MNNIFSLKRIGLILRIDWTENKRTLAVSMGLLLLSMILLIWDSSVVVQKTVFYLSALMSVIFFFSFVKKKIHKAKGLSLTLPASTLEKFTCLWIVGIFYFLTCTLMSLLVIQGLSLITGNFAVSLSTLLSNVKHPSLAVFLTAWLFLSYVTFRKNAFLAGIASLILLIVILARLFWGIAQSGLASESMQEKMAGFFTFLGDHYSLVLYLLSAVLVYLSYLLLVKKQIR